MAHVQLYDNPAVICLVRTKDGENHCLLSRLCQYAVNSQLLVRKWSRVPGLSLVSGVAVNSLTLKLCFEFITSCCYSRLKC